MIILLLTSLLMLQPAEGSPGQPDTEGQTQSTSETPSELELLKTRHLELKRTTPLNEESLDVLLQDVMAYNERNPYLPESLILEARINVMMNRFEQADALYRRALTSDPERIMDGLEWAALVHTQSPEQAIATLRELADLAPERMGYWMGLYEYLYKFAPEQIGPEFEQLLSEDGMSVQMTTLIDTIGKLNLDLGVELGRRLHERFPDDAEATFAYARRLRYANRYNDTRILLETLPDDLLLRPDIGVLYSDSLYMDHHFRQSIEHLLAFEGNVDHAYQAHNRDRDWRLNTRPKMIEYWETEQAIREEQSGANPQVRLLINGNPVLLELHAINAPTTVANFLSLVRSGFFTDTPFHSVRAGFVSQGGVPDGETFPSYAGPGYSIADESDRTDARSHFSGSIAMAKVSEDQLVGSQFYITHVPAHHLNGRSPVFGHVLEGLDVVRAMRGGERLDSIEIVRPGTAELPQDFDILTPDGVTIRHSELHDHDQSPPSD